MFKLVPHEVIEVPSIPPCNFCKDGTPGPYDFKTYMGPWANGCQEHWEKFRAHTTLGTGKGQLWLTKEQVTKGVQLESIMVELNTGLMDDETCNKRLDEIGATEDDLVAYMEWSK